MNQKRYEVYMDGQKAATYMTLDTALLLVKSLFETYYNESIKIVIKEEGKACLETSKTRLVE